MAKAQPKGKAPKTSTKIFVNLPVDDLDRSIEFFRRLGYAFNPQFTDGNAACMVISDDIFAMLLRKDFFRTFTQKDISDTRTSTEVLLALSMESRKRVDELVDMALRAGATSTKGPMDMGSMYQRSFDDLDGHSWEIFWMDPKSIR